MVQFARTLKINVKSVKSAGMLIWDHRCFVVELLVGWICVYCVMRCINQQP